MPSVVCYECALGSVSECSQRHVANSFSKQYQFSHKVHITSRDHNQLKCNTINPNKVIVFMRFHNVPTEGEVVFFGGGGGGGEGGGG